MNRQLVASGWYRDHLPSGAWCVLIPNNCIVTHLGIVPFPSGEAFGPCFLRATHVGGWRFAGQAHDTLNPACWERDGAAWVPYAPPCVGVSPVIYDNLGVLHRSDGSVGSQGYRFVNEANQIISGDATYRIDLGGGRFLFEYTDLGGLLIGQGATDGSGIQVWDGATLRQLERGNCRFLRANRVDQTVTLAFTRPEGVVLIRTTMAELRALPPVEQPEPPIPPEPPDPAPEPGPEPPDPIPPHPEPGPEPAYHALRKVRPMEIDGKTVILRGPAGKLASPDAPNTGTWGGLNAGWRGVFWFGAHDSFDHGTHHRATKAPDGNYTFTSLAHNGLAGADATKHSGAIDQQFYYKPDGNTDAGGYETWRVYQGAENGALLAMIEYVNSEGKYFACGLAVEVVE